MAKKNKKLRHAPGYRKKTKKVSGQSRTFPQESILQQALTLHQAGHLSKAEAIYGQILSAAPDHPEALHYFGILAHQMGKYEIAVELISKALSFRPDYVDAHINLGASLKAEGKLDEAVASYSQALTLKPDYALAHFNLGNVLKAQGRLIEAVACYRQALTLKPDYAVAHFNLGNILNEQGKLDEAISCYRQALTLMPDYAEAYNNLGNILIDLGRVAEAVASFRKGLTLKPDDAVAHFNLGNALKELNKPNEAVASILKAIALEPDFAKAHRSLGLIFRELGRNDEAIACFRKALILKPDYAAAYRNLSLIVNYTDVNNDIRSMENLYSKKGDIQDADRIDLGFALGKVFEDLGDYDKSFTFISEANLLKRSSFEYAIQEDSDLFARIKKSFSPGFFASHQSSGYQDSTPIFIVGMPRSGTTLVEQILASHPLVFGAGELAFLTDLADGICSGNTTARFPECILDLDPSVFAKMGSEYIEAIHEGANEAEYITDKMPYNFLHVGLIKTILPDAKIIHCMRNPMDTCFSIFKTEFMGTHCYAYDMVELGQYYNLYQDLMAHWEKVLPGFMYSIRYEELVSDQQKQTESLLEFCGLPWDEACLAFHKTERRVRTASLAQVRKPIYKDSVELWKRYEKQLEPLRKAIYE